jgi:streptogramin lyase
MSLKHADFTAKICPNSDQKSSKIRNFPTPEKNKELSDFPKRVGEVWIAAAGIEVSQWEIRLGDKAIE